MEGSMADSYESFEAGRGMVDVDVVGRAAEDFKGGGRTGEDYKGGGRTGEDYKGGGRGLEVVRNVLTQAGTLGGFFVVAFVTPIDASNGFGGGNRTLAELRRTRAGIAARSRSRVRAGARKATKARKGTKKRTARR
jgi:hypothetical protein